MKQILDEQIAVMQAFRNGKKIEFKRKRSDSDWLYMPQPSWDWHQIDYRVMPPKPREFWLHPVCSGCLGDNHRQIYDRNPNPDRDTCAFGDPFIHVREVLP